MDIRKWSSKYSKDCRLTYSSKNTTKSYTSQVNAFLHHFQHCKEPKEISVDQIKNWLLTVEIPSTRNQMLSALKSFYSITVGMPKKLDHIPFAKKREQLPNPLSIKEVKMMLDSCENLKHKAIMTLLFGCGLRVGEVINMKPEHINRKRMVIYIKNGKGSKDRFVPLDEMILKTLEDYYRKYNPNTWLFNGQGSNEQNPTKYSASSINLFLKKIAIKAGIKSRVYSHLGRHSYATALIEAGEDIGVVQHILGHKDLKTTLIYAKLSAKRISQVKSPLNS